VERRNTNQRRAIRTVFEASDRPLSTQEVLEIAQKSKPGMGIATVYRTLKLLLDSGWLALVRLPDQPPRYERAGQPHHHHFYCNACGRAFVVPGCTELLERLVPAQFALEGHDLVLNGRCRDCVARGLRAPTSP
jgi:Fur family ferric uptake transcriptional regulator